MKTLNAILTHQTAAQVGRMAEFWTSALPASDILIIHGGKREEFEKIRHPHKAFVSDPRLRTRLHRRERQSYGEVFRHIAAGCRGFTHVLFAEYDLYPLVPVAELYEAYAEYLLKERADAIFRLLYEVQGTCQEVYLPYRDEPEFTAFWKSVSVRPDPGVVLWALLPGSFWTAEAVMAVAAVEEIHPTYFEIHLPTLAHHLGFRLRPLSDDRFVIYGGQPLDKKLDELRRQGAVVAHPVKFLWGPEKMEGQPPA